MPPGSPAPTNAPAAAAPTAPQGKESITPTPAADVSSFEAPEGYTDFNSDLDEAFGVTRQDPEPEPARSTPEPRPTEPAKEPRTADDLDKMFAKVEPPPKPATPQQQPKPADAQQPPAEDLKTPKGLRDAYERRVARVTELESELKAAQEQLTTRLDDGKSKEMADLVKTLQDKVDNYESAIRFQDYTASAEYREKYVEPITQAFNEAYGDLEDVTITDMNTGEERKATPEDFDRLVSLNPKEAAKLANEWFGPYGQHVLSRRNSIISLDRARRTAIESYKKNGAEIEKQREAKEQAAKVESRRLYDQTNKEIISRFPEHFAPDPDDPKTAELLQQGFQLYDNCVSQDSPFSGEQKVKMAAVIRSKAAGFDLKVYQNERLKAEIASLKEELAQYRRSEPGDHRGATSAPSPVAPNVPAGEDGYPSIETMISEQLDPNLRPSY